MKISRRTLAKALAAGGTAAGLSRLLDAAPAVTDALTPKAWIQVQPGVWRATIGKPERFTPVAARLIPALTDAFAKLPGVHTAPLPPIQGRQTARGSVVQLPLRAGEQIFGLGLQMLSFSQRGKKKVVRVNADPRLDTGDSHAPVPFYVTTEGIGILIDTARYATFYFGDARPKPDRPAEAAKGASVDPNYSHTVQAGDTGMITVEVPRTTGVDVYLFAGPDMLGAVKRYNIFSGGGFVPPEWGLGFWYRAEAHATQQEALAIANVLRDEKMPCDVLGLEPGWQSHAYSCSFAWDKDRFPDPAGFVQSTSSLQFKINLWEHAFIHPSSPLFPSVESCSGDYGVWGGLVSDFAAEPAREAFAAYHAQNFVDLGIGGFKLDECDNSDFTSGWSFPELSSFPSGIDGELMHSVFGLRYQMAIWDAYRRRAKETYGMVRSSGALAAPYPFVLYSDLYGHRDYIRALVNSGFSGLLWCPEVRDAASEEDFIRRVQSVVFSPLAMIDCWFIRNPPWKQLDRKKNNEGELYPDWGRLEARCREIMNWRMQLVPYLTAAFQQYAADGTPPFRALILDAPHDQRLFTVDDQYMVGDRMMVAPLFAGEPTRKVVIPAGNWHDFWTGEAIKGNSEMAIAASTDRIPVYIKSGSIVPWANAGLFAGAPETRRITARIYGDGSIPFALKVREKMLRLSWNNGRGTTEGEDSGFDVIAWQQMG